MAGHNLPLVFLISGLVALLVAYSYAVLGRQIVSDAGPIAFILRGFGDTLLTGTLSVLFWMSYVVSIGLFAKGFAGYLLPTFDIAPVSPRPQLIETAVVLLFTLLGALGSRAVGRAEFTLVLVKVGILCLFILAGLQGVQPARVMPHFDAQSVSGTLSAVSLFFLSYMGFGLVTNASEHMRDPQRNVPRALYCSILIVSLIYVGVAVVAVGNLPLEELIRSQENALAVAARPFLGDLGFQLISWGALISIASALNATLYGGANVAYALARDGELPELFERKVWFGSPEGLYLTAGLGLLFALLFDLGGISSITSAVFMAIYLFVLLSHWRLRHRFGGNALLIGLAIFVVLAVFGLLMAYQWHSNRGAFIATWAVFAGTFLVEFLLRRVGGRTFTLDWLEEIAGEMRRIRFLHPGERHAPPD
ncbi:MAG: APC family permease [Gammaproteobacteria bacterium]|nr:MAG: APC family permease [Gammaproteobacteria bacterium]